MASIKVKNRVFAELSLTRKKKVDGPDGMHGTAWRFVFSFLMLYFLFIRLKKFVKMTSFAYQKNGPYFVPFTCPACPAKPNALRILVNKSKKIIKLSIY